MFCDQKRGCGGERKVGKREEKRRGEEGPVVQERISPCILSPDKLSDRGKIVS